MLVCNRCVNANMGYTHQDILPWLCLHSLSLAILDAAFLSGVQEPETGIGGVYIGRTVIRKSWNALLIQMINLRSIKAGL